jgi:PAS domain S-box-containing protein
LLLLEPSGSSAFDAIASAAGRLPLRVEPLERLDERLPEGTLVGIGPSVPDPVQVARTLSSAGSTGPLVFFADSSARLDSIRAELLRDPFASQQHDLLRVDAPRQLAEGLERVVRRLRRSRRSRAVEHVRRHSIQPQPSPQAGDQFLTSILEHANDAILSTDAHGCLVTANSAAERLFRLSADAVVGRAIGLLDLEPGGGLGAIAIRVLRSGEPETGAVVCRRADETTVEVLVSVAAIRDAHERVRGLSVIAHDHSEQQQAAEALREANRQKDEFLAIMSHELRTPLTSILGYTDMLLRGLGGDLPHRGNRYIGHIRAAGDRLLELVNGLLDYTRLEAGNLRLALRRTELGPLVAQVVERCADQARAKGIAFQTALDGAPGPVMADPDKVEHVLGTYVANALKFTPADGWVRVEVGPDPQHPGQARVSVSDSGIGLRNDQLSRVWERFYQADASLTRAYGGMGLGLSIARHLVELHGGHVGVESPGPGQGSTFWLSLPLAA